VRNRIVSTAHLTGFAENGCRPSDLNYWVSKARRHRPHLTEDQAVHPSAATDSFVIQAYRDECIGPFRRIAGAVHEHGAKIVAQLWHPGSIFYGVREGSLPLWSCSALPGSFHGETSHAMEVEEVHEVVGGFADAARRMREAGMDGVELMGTHGFLIEQFLSPRTNHRDDEYGGSEENRLRFVRELVDAVRNAVGSDFTVGLRISGDQYQDGGLSLDDMKRIMPTLTASQKLDYLSVTVGAVEPHPTHVHSLPPSSTWRRDQRGGHTTAGRVNDPVKEDPAKNQADMVGMTRPSLTLSSNKARGR
jgi:2,4-dienoyl-CoA reductase-like NADH-dependent reductase (Old Yellow Enzyme family)